MDLTDTTTPLDPSTIPHGTVVDRYDHTPTAAALGPLERVRVEHAADGSVRLIGDYPIGPEVLGLLTPAQGWAALTGCPGVEGSWWESTPDGELVVGIRLWLTDSGGDPYGFTGARALFCLHALAGAVTERVVAAATALAEAAAAVDTATT